MNCAHNKHNRILVAWGPPRDSLSDTMLPKGRVSFQFGSNNGIRYIRSNLQGIYLKQKSIKNATKYPFSRWLGFKTGHVHADEYMKTMEKPNMGYLILTFLVSNYVGNFT